MVTDVMQRAPNGFDSAFGEWVTANFAAIKSQAEATTWPSARYRAVPREQVLVPAVQLLRPDRTSQGNPACVRLDSGALCGSGVLSWRPT